MAFSPAKSLLCPASGHGCKLRRLEATQQRIWWCKTVDVAGTCPEETASSSENGIRAQSAQLGSTTDPLGGLPRRAAPGNTSSSAGCSRWSCPTAALAAGVRTPQPVQPGMGAGVCMRGIMTRHPHLNRSLNRHTTPLQDARGDHSPSLNPPKPPCTCSSLARCKQ